MPLLFAMVLLLAGCRAERPAQSAASPPAPDQLVVFGAYAHATDPGVETAKSYEFTVRDNHFRMDPGGRMTCTTGNVIRGTFQLDLEDMPYVEQVQYLPYGPDTLVLLYELSDGESGAGRIARVNLPTLELVSSSQVPGFNLGQVAMEGSNLYVSATGFVGSFDVKAWRYVWTHGNLYEQYGFNAFGKPVVLQDRVTFPEIAVSSDVAIRSVVVQKLSGAMTIERGEPRL